METRDAITKRFSAKSYLDKKVDKGMIAEILDVAKNAPSSGNLQNWKVVVVDDKEKKNQIVSTCLSQKWMNQASVFIVVCNDHENVNKMYGARGKDIYSVQNCAAFIQNILTAATDLGLNSCWVGSFEIEKLKQILRIPDNVRPEVVITLGYSDEIKQETRISIDNFSYINEYGNKIVMKPPMKIVSEGFEIGREKSKGFFGKIFRRLRK